MRGEEERDSAFGFQRRGVTALRPNHPEGPPGAEAVAAVADAVATEPAMLISYSSLLLFVTGAAILLVIPGPAVFYTVSRSVGHGEAANGERQLAHIFGHGVLVNLLNPKTALFFSGVSAAVRRACPRPRDASDFSARRAVCSDGLV